MRFITATVIVLALAVSVPAQVTPAAERGPAAAPAAPRVSVMFTASDNSGNPIRGVTKEQVSVFDNNQPAQTLEVQSASDLPLDLGIVLLASKDKFAQEQAAAIDLVQKVVRPGKDRVFVITAGGEKPWQGARLNWSTDPADAAQTIRGLDKDAGFPDPFNYRLEVTGSGLQRDAIEHYSAVGGMDVFEIVFAMMRTNPNPVRRAVAIFRLATQHSPGMQSRVRQDIENSHMRVITIAQAMTISFYPIALEDKMPASDTARASISQSYVPTYAGQDTGTREYDDQVNRERELQYTAGRHNVDRLADDTGGRSYWAAKKNYTDAVAGIANELAARYVVSFAPAGASTAQVHPLKVQVSRAARVSAPHAFVLPK